MAIQFAGSSPRSAAAASLSRKCDESSENRCRAPSLLAASVLAAAANRGKQAIGLAGDKEEICIVRRLFQSLQQSVLRNLRPGRIEQLRFIDNEHFAVPMRGGAVRRRVVCDVADHSADDALA